MKRSHTQGNAVLRRDDGTVHGVVLAADYCGQHEGGVERLQSMFGIEGGDAGFAGHTARWGLDRMAPVTAGHERREGRRKVVDRCLCLTTGRDDPVHLGEMLRRHDDAPIIGAWDDRDFAIAGYGEEGEAVVRMLHEGIAQGDVAIWIGGAGDNPFARGGLAIARPSLTPNALTETFDRAQEERRALKAATLATGIEARLEAMRTPFGHFSLPAFHALAPRWTPEDRRADTVHPVILFLNPSDGRTSNHGWFTVEELDQWIEGRGPVPREAA